MTDSGQLSSTAAEVYDEFFVPALFGAWGLRVVAAADLQSGMRVIDVACGTGVLAIEAAKATSPGGAVVGVDLNPGMLSVARQKSEQVDWHQAPAEHLPFDSGTFDAALSQFGLMFFEDQQGAVAEMWRVIRPGGRLAIAVWDSLGNSPGYAAITKLLARLFGADVAALLEAPFSLGDQDALRSLFRSAGISHLEIRQVLGEARFPSIRSWMHSDVRGWTLADRMDDTQFERLVFEAEHELDSFVMDDASVRFAQPALIASASKPTV